MSQNVTPSKKHFKEIIDIEPDVLEDTEDGEIIETATKFEFNLGFAKSQQKCQKGQKW